MSSNKRLLWQKLEELLPIYLGEKDSKIFKMYSLWWAERAHKSSGLRCWRQNVAESSARAKPGFF